MSETTYDKEEELFLRIAEAKNKDVARGIARIDPDLMRVNNLSSGDAILISNPLTQRFTGALLWPGYIEDAGSNLIRIDGITRRNIGTALDERVQIKKIEVKKAISVTLAPVGSKPINIKYADYFAKILENRVFTSGDVLPFSTMTGHIHMAVVSFQPRDSEAVIISSATKIKIVSKPVKPEELKRQKVQQITYNDIGGLNDEIQKVREMIELPMRHPEIFERLGISPPKGVLLFGPPGTGKTLLARAVANETDAHFISLTGPEIMSKFYGQSEENLRNVFKEAEEYAPAIIFIDEIDSIAPKRGETQGDVERRVVAQLLSLMDGLDARGNVVIIGATNRLNALDPALRRPGRFDREIELGVPDKDGRYDILQIHTRGMPLEKNIDLEYYAAKTHGFVGADLAMVGKEAAMKTLRRILPDINLDENVIPPEVLNTLTVTKEDFDAGMNEVEPSALREVYIQTPTETWEDVGGLEEAKQLLRETIEWPLKYPNIYKHMNSSPPKGILLYGLPGTGKTLLAKALAHESEVNFISVKGPEFLSKWVGESEKAIRETFRKARTSAPCIIFLDELDAIAPIRGRSSDSGVSERVISQLLTEMDGLETLKNVVLVAATNRPDIIDPALLRAGRFGRHIEIPLPDPETREKIFEIHLKNIPKGDIDIQDLVKKMEDRSGADIGALCQEAIGIAIREAILTGGMKDTDENIDEIKLSNKHFTEALKSIEKEVNRSRKSYMAQEGALPLYS